MKKTLLLFVTILLFSCNESDQDKWNSLDFDQSAFEKNQKSWKEKKIVNYTFTQEYSSGSVGPNHSKITCIVKNGLFDSASDKYGGNLESLTYYKTVDEVFNFIEKIVISCEKDINSKDSPLEGARIDVEYDSEYHYPTKIDCTGHYPEEYVGSLSTQIIFSEFKTN